MALQQSRIETRRGNHLDRFGIRDACGDANGSDIQLGFASAILNRIPAFQSDEPTTFRQGHCTRAVVMITAFLTDDARHWNWMIRAPRKDAKKESWDDG